ncbi:MAG: aspartate aminotransferase family protein [Rhodospirillaceae bacterium]|jgi:4-aminobutyrate aminotransferase|nr:aspartate aminotransferase family protein [Rhodospirillaceae bacterium]MBT5244717.1 aspartate aminotransferase family protein [Rhodospirillaceae bacterium]MBT5562458.1 aspartate aminotransferase family protein [Rhodospirillaceae bacterium]MBT6242096.1 aspartate aminotransferase family protein [Rhodospirillaceae bacterium]MBT7136513.1 aspartate aminotransferase family protein [Rhodospirillaceae bacterium]
MGKDILHPSEGDSNLSPGRAEWSRSVADGKSAKLLAEDADHFLRQSLSTPCLAAITKADGIWLEDADGNRYMDFHGNNVHHIGYGNKRLIAALKDQMDDLSFAPRRFTNQTAVDLAAKLTSIAPKGLSKVLFSTGGSDANEMALKLARAATGRHKTISFWDAFHGAGFGGASVGGESLFRSGPAGPLLSGTEHVAPFSCYRCPYGYAGPDLSVCKMTCAEMVRYVLEKEGDVAAVIAEPVRSVPYLPPPGFWKSVREACNDHGALLIFDDIPNGLGKTGRMFSSDHFDAVPDILTLGKSLGGGILPIAAMITRPELDVLEDRALGHYTHEKNPVTCRAALTTIDIIEDEGLVENAARVGAHALERLNDMKNRHPVIGDVRGIGLVMGLDLVEDVEAKAPAMAAADRILYRALKKGLNFKTTMGSVLTLTPPLIITTQEMDQALDILEACIAEEA